MRDSFQRTPLVILQHPSAFDALGGLLPSVFKLPELSRESPRQNSPVPSSRKAPRRIPAGGSCSGSFPPPSSAFLRESRAGAGRAAAAVAAAAFSARGHMRQVQSQQWPGEEGDATRPCEPLVSSPDVAAASAGGSIPLHTFTAGCLGPKPAPRGVTF